MTDQLISLETANLAEKKGFNGVSYFNKFDMMGNQILCNQSLLKRWLREVHGIHIWVQPYKDDDITTYEWTIASDLFNEDDDGIDEYHKSYELALEEGLKQSLNLIK